MLVAEFATVGGTMLALGASPCDGLALARCGRRMAVCSASASFGSTMLPAVVAAIRFLSAALLAFSCGGFAPLSRRHVFYFPVLCAEAIALGCATALRASLCGGFALTLCHGIGRYHGNEKDE